MAPVSAIYQKSLLSHEQPYLKLKQPTFGGVPISSKLGSAHQYRSPNITGLKKGAVTA